MNSSPIPRSGSAEAQRPDARFFHERTFDFSAAERIRQMARAAPPDHQPRLQFLRRLSDAAQPELLVDVRRHPHRDAGVAAGHRHRAGHALHAARRPRLQLRRADHARRQLRLAPALSARQRRLDVLPRRLYPHGARPLLRLLQGAARGVVDPRRHPVPADDRHRVHGLRAPLGPDELLGGDRDYQPVLRHSGRRRGGGVVAMGRLRGRQSHAQPVLLAALPVAVRDRRRGRAARLGAAHGRPEQPGRRRAQVGEGHGRVHALRHHQGCVPDRGVLHPVRLVRVLPAEHARPLRTTTSRPTRR